MPKHVVRNRYLAINGTAIQDHCSTIEITDSADEIELTSFTTAGYKQFGLGFKDCAVTATIFSDFDVGQVNSIIQPLYATGGTCQITVREDAGLAVSSSNPQGTMTAVVSAYAPLAGAVNAAAQFQTTFRNAGTSGIVWGTV